MGPGTAASITAVPIEKSNMVNNMILLNIRNLHAFSNRTRAMEVA